MTRIFLFITAVIQLLTCIFLLTARPDILALPLLNNPAIPAGTLISWTGLVALPLSALSGIKKIWKPVTAVEKGFRIALILCIVMSLAWGVAGYVLADNWSYVFTNQEEFRGSDRAAILFFRYTLTVVIIPLISLLVYSLYCISSRVRRKIRNGLR